MQQTISDSFSSNLLRWHKHDNNRIMPWKGIKDPYKIWLSEIILQQTRVAQGEKYYESFIRKFPTINDLAAANEEEVFKMWEGLGYYNRCRNMMFTAKFISKELNGIFPNEYEKILALKGIGDYSAAAIGSFAFDLPFAVVDGNVVRVLSRFFALPLNYFETKGKKEIQKLAQSLLPIKKSAFYNQAIMDLGATICKPLAPTCEICPLKKSCKAYCQNQVSLYPIKKEKKPLKERHFHFLVFSDAHHFYLQKRNDNDIWKDLHTFTCIETKKMSKKLLPSFFQIDKLGRPIQLNQTLTHQKIFGYFYLIALKDKLPETELKLIRVKKKELHKFAFPKMIVSFLQKINYL